MSPATSRLRPVKLHLDPEERRALRGAHLRRADLVVIEPEELARTTSGSIGVGRARELCALARLQQLPSIGPAMAADLVELGCHAPEDLVGKSPERLFRRLEQLRGKQDPCVADTIACAVYYSENPEAPQDRPWWHWSKQRLEAASRSKAGREEKRHGTRKAR